MEITVVNFKKALLEKSISDILTEIILTKEAKHVSIDKQLIIKNKLASVFNIDSSEISIYVVGSANLGFSISEKTKGGVFLPRYRLFSLNSDIDIAVISPKLWDIVWEELSKFSYSQPFSPWDSGKLGDYLVGGWFRPDLFPKGERLRKCDDWWDTFRRFSSNRELGRRQIRGGLYYNLEHLRTYQGIAIKECIQNEKINKLKL